MRYLIIGNSAAGTFAAERIRKNDVAGQIDILTDEAYPAYARCMTSYYLTGKYSEQSMYLRPDEHARKLNMQIHFKEACVRVDAKKQEAMGKSGKIYPYDKLLIASGAYAVRPKMEGSDVGGVHVLRSLDDAKHILARAQKTRHAVVVGGGFVSLKTAYALLSSGIEVTCVISSDYMLSRILDRQSGEMMAQYLMQKGLRVIYSNDVVRVIPDGQGDVQAIQLKDGSEIECELVVIGKGVMPNLDFLEGSGVQTDWGIITDQYLRTSVENIYAAGDCAQSHDLVTGQQTINALWPNATEQGAFAGENMTGNKAAYPGSIGMNAATFFDLVTIGAGTIKPEECDGCEVVTRTTAGGLYRRFVFKDDVLVGFYLMGDVARAGTLTSFVKNQTKLGKAKREILAGNYSPLIAF